MACACQIWMNIFGDYEFGDHLVRKADKVMNDE